MTERTRGEARRANLAEMQARAERAEAEVEVEVERLRRLIVELQAGLGAIAWSLDETHARREARWSRLIDATDGLPAEMEDRRNAALEEAARAVEGKPPTGRDWVPGSLYDTLRREAAAAIRALKT